MYLWDMWTTYMSVQQIPFTWNQRTQEKTTYNKIVWIFRTEEIRVLQAQKYVGDKFRLGLCSLYIEQTGNIKLINGALDMFRSFCLTYISWWKSLHNVKSQLSIHGIFSKPIILDLYIGVIFCYLILSALENM